MKFGVLYFVLGSNESYLEFVEDESLEAVIHRVKTNDFTGVRFARTGLDEVPYIDICDDKGFCLYRIPVTELQHNDFGYIPDNYVDYEADDVENNTASEQGIDVEVQTCGACSFCFYYGRKPYQRKFDKSRYCRSTLSPFFMKLLSPSFCCSYFLPK